MSVLEFSNHRCILHTFSAGGVPPRPPGPARRRWLRDRAWEAFFGEGWFGGTPSSAIIAPSFKVGSALLGLRGDADASECVVVDARWSCSGEEGSRTKTWPSWLLARSMATITACAASPATNQDLLISSAYSQQGTLRFYDHTCQWTVYRNSRVCTVHCSRCHSVVVLTGGW